eukprot:3940583-Rhodomonas_salina.4
MDQPVSLLSEEEIDIQSQGERFSPPRKRLRRGKARVLSSHGSGPTRNRFHSVGFHQSLDPYIAREHLYTIETGTTRAVTWDPSPDSKIAGWSLHQTDPEAYGLWVAQNLGPVGWCNSRDQLAKALSKQPGIACFSYISLPLRFRTAVLLSLKARYPEYSVYFSFRTTRVRIVGTKRSRHYCLAALTMVRKDLHPDVHAVDLRSLLGKQQTEVCSGRLLVNQFKSVEGHTCAVVNIYQYTTSQPQQRKQLYELLNPVLQHLRRECVWVGVVGDWNASFPGQLSCSQTDLSSEDAQFNGWASSQNLTRASQAPEYTYSNSTGARAVLDHALV